MPAHASIDSFTSPTLKHLRERWWNDDFTEFLVETLRPRPGNRILDVGCGEGLAEVSIGRRQLSQIRLVGVDHVAAKVVIARRETAAHNQRVSFAAADAVRLPFKSGAFDSTYCVAVLQHVHDVESAVEEFARVTREAGRVVAVEPDNAARYAYSSVPGGAKAFEAVRRLLAEVAAAGGESTDPVVGPTLAERFARHGIEPVEVRVFPVSHTLLGETPPAVWMERRQAIERAVDASSSAPVQALAKECLTLLAEYEAQATTAGPAFVEIQSTSLFATVGQRMDTR
jgi:ubiquinone/menaquinone biosynthesis C-methylase UbiE